MTLSLLSSLFDYAKNDSYSGARTSWLTEDGALKGSLNVRSNDSKLAKLTSVSAGPIGYCDPDQKSDTFSVTYEGVSYTGQLTINKDGTIGFDLSSLAGKLNSLAAGETLDVSFYYSNSILFLSDSAKVTISITGKNDGPTAAASAFTATEDGAIVTGQALGADVDHGAVLTYTLTGSTPAGFTLNANGSYAFDGSNAAWQYLSAGDTATVTANFQVKDEFGAAASSTIQITVVGTNDAATFGGASTGTVTEDDAVNSVSGLLTVNDADQGESAFTAASVSGAYGTLTIDAGGNWTYVLDNGNTAVNLLLDGQSLDDVVTVTSVDGTTSDITITINGATDGPTYAPVFEGLAADDFDDLRLTPTSSSPTSQADVLVGTDGNDVIDSDFGYDTVLGLGGDDTLSGASGFDNIYGQAGNDTLIGNVGNDQMFGGSGNDTLSGSQNNDLLVGGSGDDILSGEGGNDRLIGGYGADSLTGGALADRFVFESVLDRGDTIFDFNSFAVNALNPDKIDLSAIDADSAHTTFAYGGSTATAYGVWLVQQGADTLVSVDTDGDIQTIELWFTVAGVTNLGVEDFVL